MRKQCMLSVVVVLCLTWAAQAQELGIRLSPSNSVSSAVEGALNIGEAMRLHGDVAFSNDVVGFDVLYDFFYSPFRIGDCANFMWYAGVGGALYVSNDSEFGISMEIGVDYRFDFPLVVGVDYRPTYWVDEYDNVFNIGGFSLMARYVMRKR
ncbi:hypothetical protein BFP72_09445 [Reichenbachiella sp. 5M10]|uniref:outer membrane insertion C- signal n=1 Tax=Reichenbachiella sp. 5M10 TaxID=1889772 RepID=UPI000C6435CA|nr:outer membrane insertion C- signal [Reichenbachiella sp. 5M10]PIB35600.1 hypothetical protein BFP72_09445 [Reichenbachiella sp. 5M10]